MCKGKLIRIAKYTVNKKRYVLKSDAPNKNRLKQEEILNPYQITRQCLRRYTEIGTYVKCAV